MLTSLADLPRKKQAGERVSVLTAYDYPTARLLDECGVDLLLVGDSLGMVVLGLPDTTGVTMDIMCHHIRAVRRGVQRVKVIGDLPFHSYDTPEQALANARLLVEAGADAVKLEGGVNFIPQIRAILEAGIPFVGHLGMLPQSVREEGGYKKKGKTPAQAEQLLADALALDAAGACAIVLESVVPDVAADITRQIQATTIGIGAGSGTDGQVLVTSDLIGIFPWFRPPFAKARADVASEIQRAAKEWMESIQ